MFTPDLGAYPGFQLITEDLPSGQNDLLNTWAGDGPRQARGTDPAGFTLWNSQAIAADVTAAQIPGQQPGILDRVESWGHTIFTSAAGLVVAAILLYLGFKLLTSGGTEP